MLAHRAGTEARGYNVGVHEIAGCFAPHAIQPCFYGVFDGGGGGADGGHEPRVLGGVVRLNLRGRITRRQAIGLAEGGYLAKQILDRRGADNHSSGVRKVVPAIGLLGVVVDERHG